MTITMPTGAAHIEGADHPPKAIREALGLHEGDRAVFRGEGQRAVLARTADLLDLVGAVRVPASKRGTPWEEVRRQARPARARGLP